MVGLATTSKIRSITVFAFMLFYDGYKVEASSIYTSIYHSGNLSPRSHFSIRHLFSSFFCLSLLFFRSSHSFSSFFPSFSLSFQNTWYYCFICYYKEHQNQNTPRFSSDLTIKKNVRGVLRIWVTTASFMTYN